MPRFEMIVGGITALSCVASTAWAAGVLSPPAASGIGLLNGAALVGAVTVASMAPSLQAFGPVITRGPEVPKVALTFDDGPDPRSTEALCDALEAVGARATFFLLADRAQAAPDLVRRVATTHEVALHGPSHDPWLTLQPPARGAERLARARDLLSELAGAPVRWFRPPFGAVSPRLCEAVARAGLQTVWCSVRSYDGGPSAAARVRARCAKAGPGDIVLLHEGARPARNVLPEVLSDLADRGLTSCTVGELLA